MTTWWLLGLGGMATVLTGPRWGIGALAWVAPIPFLLYARHARGWRTWSALFGVLLLGFAVQCVMFATPPVPVIGVTGFAPPLAALRFAALGVGELVRRRLGERAGLLTYVAGTVAFDWVGYGASEFGAWMATANSQVMWPALLQFASVAGLAGIGALMAWAAGTMAMVIAAPAHAVTAAARTRHVVAVATVLVGVLLWGTSRLDRPIRGRTVPVAAVVTDVGPTEQGLPDAQALAANADALFARTHAAAARGARLVVWNEIATVIQPEEEEAFTARARATARELGIDLVLAYAVLEGTTSVLFDNKYLFISDTGDILDTYQKHHPVPGEPSIRGTGPLRVLDRPCGRVGGAICYDYDFPAMAREHALADADLVVVPSSDWRGIDPVHTFMASVRAIEGGFTLLRAVRWAPSAVFDAHGRARAWMPATDETDGVLVAHVPVGRIPTTVMTVGDRPVVLAGGILLVLVPAALGWAPVRDRWFRLSARGRTGSRPAPARW